MTMVSSASLSEEARIDRIKQKAIRSANKELGGTLQVDSNDSAAAEIDVNFLASVLGMEIAAFGVDQSVPKKSKSKKSRAKAAQKEVVPEEPAQEAKEEPLSPKQENDPTQGNQVSLVGAQAGSLAAALGISIDPSAQAPAMRKKEESKTDEDVEASSSSEASSTLEPAAAAPGTSIEENPEKLAEPSTLVAPQVGSLAAALGMSIERVDEQKDDAPQNTENPNPGSLAAALGFQVSTAVDAYAISPPKAGSLAEALGLQVDTSQNAPPMRQSPVHTPPQTKTLQQAAPGSLAAALGMYVDPCPTSPAIRRDGQEAPPAQPHEGTTVLQKPQQGSLAAALGMSVADSDEVVAIRTNTSSEEPKLGFAAPGSLAAALGMKVDPSYNAAPIRQVGKAPPSPQPHEGTTFMGPQTAPAKAGSLAAALGMSVDMSRSAPPIRYAPTAGKKQMTLADMVMSRIESAEDSSDDDDSSVESYESDSSSSSEEDFFASNTIVAAQGGSLADALGLKVDCSKNAPPIRDGETSYPMNEPPEPYVDPAGTVEGILETHFSKFQAEALLEAMTMMTKTAVKSEIPAELRPDQQSQLEDMLKEHFSMAQTESLVAAFGIFNGPATSSSAKSSSAVPTDKKKSGKSSKLRKSLSKVIPSGLKILRVRKRSSKRKSQTDISASA